MNERQGISIAVLTADQDDVELVNRTLRDGGHVAHCHWIKSPPAFDKILGAQPLELIFLNRDRYTDTVRQVIKHKSKFHPEVPVIALGTEVDEPSILQAMKDGACDLVSVTNLERLKVVAARELRAFRAERALNSTLTSATVYRRQLKDYMQGSKSAIANMQEGIVTEANDAWLRLFRIKNADDAIGMPIMDYFAAESQAAIKGAIVATMQGKWQSSEKLQAKSSATGSQSAELELQFQLIEFDEGPFVQIRIAPPEKPAEEPTKLVHEALKRDPTTLFFHRAQFIDRIKRRLARKPQSGLHAVAYIKPDAFSALKKDVGHIASEEILALFAEEVRKRMHPRDVAGRFEGTTIMVLLERGNERDAEVWGQQLVDHMQDHEFVVNDKTVRLTCTVGVCAVNSMFASLEELVSAAAGAHAIGKKAGGNCVGLHDAADEDTRQKRFDAIWVKRIKAALREKRFRLAHLPIAGLRNDTVQMHDMLIRMLDEQRNPILPSEFLPAAERNNLMKTLDRWILQASMDYCVEKDVDRAFVRVSRHSIIDPSMTDWMAKKMTEVGVEPGRLCLQVPEVEAARYIKPIKSCVEKLRKLGVGFALQHYGVDENRQQILDILRPDYIKIDGELMHTLLSDTNMQASVQRVAAAAQQRNIETIAERVENANAMAILFQLGIHYMQGHYVEEPEVVLQEPENVIHTTLEAIAGS